MYILVANKPSEVYYTGRSWGTHPSSFGLYQNLNEQELENKLTDIFLVDLKRDFDDVSCELFIFENGVLVHSSDGFTDSFKTENILKRAKENAELKKIEIDEQAAERVKKQKEQEQEEEKNRRKKMFDELSKEFLGVSCVFKE